MAWAKCGYNTPEYKALTPDSNQGTHMGNKLQIDQVKGSYTAYAVHMGNSWLLLKAGRIVDWALITALIELWPPKTHTFHLPIGEATVMLQDVDVLYGLPADGMAVSLPIAMRYMSRDHYLDMLHQLTGFRPQDEAASSGASGLALTPIRQHLELLHPDITDDTEKEYITHYTRLLLLLLFGGVLFPNTSGNLVSLRFLLHLQLLDELPYYN
nr:PREDICTED: serine/threonine-protein phosphatase 7 long form homolog [Nicotiana tabacum]